jgi:hypothetical protein
MRLEISPSYCWGVKDWLAVPASHTPPVSDFTLVIQSLSGPPGGKTEVYSLHKTIWGSSDLDYLVPDYRGATVFDLYSVKQKQPFNDYR